MQEKLNDLINHLKAKHVDYADIRYVSRTSQSIAAKDQVIESLTQTDDIGVGVRVIVDGCWGFASTSDLSDEELEKTANRAIKIAKASTLTKRAAVVLEKVTPFVDKYKTRYKEDPFAVSLDDKINFLLEINKILRKNKSVRIAESSFDFFRTRKIFCSSEGALIEQEIMESGGGYTATAVSGSEVQRRSYPSSHGGDYACSGYEFIRNLMLVENAERVAEEAVALLKAPECPAIETDIIITGSQMALQVHESCGHPTELDRVLGTEISLAGGSFMTIDKLGHLKYGSPIVNIVADSTIEGGLGTFGYDDEGVKACRSDIIKEGIHVGYLNSRETASIIKQVPNGCMRADGWNKIPLIRMTNINLEPGDWELDELIADTKNGIMVDTNKSWSIDDKRLNFQFGQEIAWQIKDGKLGQIYKNPLYTGITPEFWNSCDAICNKNHWHIWGIPSCGKGEPMQVAHVAHGAAPTRFRNVKVGASK
ncbi:MAG: TldD/PmbA family protein [candidate division Zixibacteria bacterium]|nr:TldD/PmbA family protein [candidate division Zixibacteria bacterium]